VYEFDILMAKIVVWIKL